MGGVDRGDQLRRYYRCPTKVHKFYNYVHLLLPKGYLHYEQLHIISTVFTHQRTENPPLISSRVGQEANWRLLLQKEQDTLEIARNSSLPSSPPGCTQRSLPSVLSEKQKEGHSMVLPTVREVVLPHWQPLFYAMA